VVAYVVQAIDPATDNIQEQLRFAACQQQGCTGTNYITTLDSENYCLDDSAGNCPGGYNDPTVKISPVGRATIVYRDFQTDTLKVAVCSDPTCGSNGGGNRKDLSAMTSPAIAVPPNPPSISNMKLASDLRYVVGSRLIDACNLATRSSPYCDVIRDPLQYLPVHPLPIHEGNR